MDGSDALFFLVGGFFGETFAVNFEGCFHTTRLGTHDPLRIYPPGNNYITYHIPHLSREVGKIIDLKVPAIVGGHM